MKIIIGADIVPTKSNFDDFIEGNLTALLDDNLIELLQQADMRVFNLEVPLTDKANPIKKCGPNLIAPPETIKGIQTVGADFVTVANNHIMDQGESGLEDTFNVLKKAGIAYAGAGKTAEQAALPYIVEANGIKVGFYCCAEHEFSIVSTEKAGANPFDPLWSLDHIQELKAKCDYVVVLYHGGKEQYRYPSPELQKVCRRIADKGGDLVICQHTHCIGCEEIWNGSRIVYGQGNFLFDDCDNEYWANSILVSLQMDKEKIEVEYIPICKNGKSVRLADSEEKEVILTGFEERSEAIQDQTFIIRQYREFSEKMCGSYCNRAMGKINRTLAFRVFNKITKGRLRDDCYSSADALAMINVLECEPHRELFLAGLKEFVKSERSN